MSTANKVDIRYNIVSDYNGKGTNQATSALGKLQNATTSLGAKLTTVLGAAALEEFARRSIKAFTEEQKSIAMLDKTLVNLGMAMESTKAIEYIQHLSDTTGIMKSNIYPAFETLIRQTRDFGKATELTNLAMDISAGTGKDAGTVAIALAKAYGGSNTALSKLGAGLTATNLKHNTFGMNVKLLSATFKGDAVAAGDTYAGTINKLKNAAYDASVEIGQSLVGSIIALGSTSTSGGTLGFIKNLGDDISRVIFEATKLVIVLKDTVFMNPKDWFKSWSSQQAKINKDVGALEVAYNKTNVPFKEGLAISRGQAIQNAKDLITSKQNLVLQKNLTTEAKNQAALAKSNSALKLAGTIFDLSQIEIVAALQRNVTDDQALRLNLQLALLTQNADAAGKLSQQLLAVQIGAMEADKANPFFNWTKALQDALQALIDLQKELSQFAPAAPLTAAALSAITLGQDASAAIASANDPAYAQNTTAVNDFLSSSIDSNLATDAMAAQLDALVNGSATAGTSASSSASTGSGFFGNSSAYNPMNGNVNVTVMLDGNQVTSYINNANQNTTVGGTQLTTSRINQAAIG